MNAAAKLLANTFKSSKFFINLRFFINSLNLAELKEDPVEGFSVELFDESNLFEWKVRTTKK
jgi:hypothetical protein